MTRPT